MDIVFLILIIFVGLLLLGIQVLGLIIFISATTLEAQIIGFLLIIGSFFITFKTLK